MAEREEGSVKLVLRGLWGLVEPADTLMARARDSLGPTGTPGQPFFNVTGCRYADIQVRSHHPVFCSFSSHGSPSKGHIASFKAVFNIPSVSISLTNLSLNS